MKGAGVFRKGRLVGWLDEEEANGLLWARGEVKRGMISAPLPSQPSKTLSVVFQRASSEIKPQVKGEEIKFQMTLRGYCELATVESYADLEREGEMEVLEKAINQAVEEKVKRVLEKAQKEFKSDIFGLGESLRRKNFRLWNKVQDKWNEAIFPQVQVEVKGDLKLQWVGMTTRPPRETGERGGKGIQRRVVKDRHGSGSRNFGFPLHSLPGCSRTLAEEEIEGVGNGWRGVVPRPGPELGPGVPF